MSFVRSIAAASLLVSTCAFAQHDARQLAEDVNRHKAIAEAHRLVADCFAQGKGKEACIALQKSVCFGLGLGKYCGIKEDAMNDPVKSLRLAAQAHDQAASCIASGKPYEDCIWELQSECKGIGIGKECGMLHFHSF